MSKDSTVELNGGTFTFKQLNIPGLTKISAHPFSDDRGFFMRTYDSEIFKTYGLPTNWPESYESYNIHSFTVRGFHFQHYNAQTKLIRVNSGEALFTTLDLRTGSPTFGQWEQNTLTENSPNTMLLIPKGCALCMCTLQKNTRLLYQMDNTFIPESYDAIVWNSPELNIPWPINKPQIISSKDATAQTFSQFVDKYKGLNLS